MQPSVAETCRGLVAGVEAGLLVLLSSGGCAGSQLRYAELRSGAASADSQPADIGAQNSPPGGGDCDGRWRRRRRAPVARPAAAARATTGCAAGGWLCRSGGPAVLNGIPFGVHCFGRKTSAPRRRKTDLSRFAAHLRHGSKSQNYFVKNIIYIFFRATAPPPPPPPPPPPGPGPRPKTHEEKSYICPRRPPRGSGPGPRPPAPAPKLMKKNLRNKRFPTRQSATPYYSCRRWLTRARSGLSVEHEFSRAGARRRRLTA